MARRAQPSPPAADTPPVALHKLPPQLKVLVRTMGRLASDSWRSSGASIDRSVAFHSAR